MLHFPVHLEILVRYNTILSSLLPRNVGSPSHPPTKATRITSTGVSSAIQTLNSKDKKGGTHQFAACEEAACAA